MDAKCKLSKKAIIFIAVAVLVVLAIAIPCIVCSFQPVPPNYYGLNFNNIKKTLNDEKVYDTGRHAIGVSSQFLLFPSTVLRLTRDDVKITDKTTSYSFSISVLYTIDKDNLVEIYRSYKTPETLNSMLSTKTQTALVAYCPTSTTYEQYYNSREELERKFLELLTPVFEDTFCTVVDVQLRTVEYINNIENQLVSYPTTQLQGKLALLNGTVTNMREQIAAETAKNTALIQGMNADNDAKIRKSRAENDAKIIAAQSKSSSYRAQKLVKPDAGGGEDEGFFSVNEYVRYERLTSTPALGEAGSRVVVTVPFS